MPRARLILSLLCAGLLIAGSGAVLFIALEETYRAMPIVLLAATLAFWLGVLWVYKILAQ